MTTVAYRDGVLASDTMATTGEFVIAVVSKLAERDGWLLAGSGDHALIQKFFRVFNPNEFDSISFLGDASGIAISPNGNVFTFESGSWYQEKPADFYVWGGGFAVALGALHAGASAEEAIRIVSIVHTKTGGDIETLEIAKAGKVVSIAS